MRGQGGGGGLNNDDVYDVSGTAALWCVVDVLGTWLDGRHRWWNCSCSTSSMSSSCCFWLSLDPIQTDSPENKEKLLQKKLSKHPTQTVVLVFCIQKLINRLGKKKIRLETSPDKSFVGMICKVRSGSEKNSFGSRALLSGSKFFSDPGSNRYFWELGKIFWVKNI